MIEFCCAEKSVSCFLLCRESVLTREKTKRIIGITTLEMQRRGRNRSKVFLQRAGGWCETAETDGFESPLSRHAETEC